MSRSYTRKRKRHEAHLRHEQTTRKRKLDRRAKVHTKVSSRTAESW